jgi:hypothetical protein
MRYRYPLNTRVFPFLQSAPPIQPVQPRSTKSVLNRHHAADFSLNLWTPTFFLTFLDGVLCPTLHPDNLSSHKVVGVRQHIEACEAEPLYLPPDSPLEFPREGLGPSSSRSSVNSMLEPPMFSIRSPRKHLAKSHLPTRVHGSDSASKVYS